ncbi:uncharacterized protein LOC134291501 [Aedes albopictus]|uniref:Integrase catalytic domain-containing protein n=1 Tax=Aedes albopictus TaxID=7160 RepID=A0ABM1XVP6_AEDAL
MSTNERWKKVQNLGLCRTCLFNHGRRPCRINNRCGVNNCQTRHHPLLHSNANDASELAASTPLDLHFHSGELPSLLFRIIPVNLYNGLKKVSTYAFLDEGSNISMIERKLAAMLDVTGYRRPLCLKWTGNVTKEEEESHRITVEISGAHQDAAKYIISEVGTVDSLDLPRQSLPIENLAGRFRHLQGLPIQGYCNVTPQLLIGVDNLKLAIPLKVREGREGGPTAAKTRLGWCVYGGHREESQLSMNYHVCECSEVEHLDKTLKAYFTLEEAGIQSGINEIAQDDERALRILEQTTKRVGERYESGLLWRYDDFEFPDSYAMAVKRLQCLERRLAKDPALNDNVRKQIHEYESKGYAHRASPEELTEADLRRVWYLPLGAVCNPRKPGKVRLIWDASAKVDGISLNSMLLKGPDQLTLLPAVLFRFRQYPVAVSADIKEMFHQVRIRSEDRHAQRFVYRSNPASPPETYLMNVATFGSSCSPATAQFVKNTNANMFAHEYPRAVQGIVHNHYVDDYLDSFASTEEAVQIASQVKMIHQYGGFEIRNWCSNERVVLEQLGEGKEQTVIDLDSGADKQSDRVLGLSWDTEADEFRYNTYLLSDISRLRETNTKPTKRQLARCVMSFFDPQGFLAPYLVFGKVLLQDTWREGTGWDEQIDDRTFERWQEWLDILDDINNVRIPRCYFSKGDLSTLEIHTFVDASEVSYSCVTYFRITNPYGSAEVAFVASKTKVAPLKPTTIPRLELMACVLGVRLAMFAVDGHSLAVKKHFFWTDAEVAMSWIYADPRKYRPFVAFRVGEILEKSNREDWRWVSSKQNPADEATKWGVGPHFSKNSIWYEGPEFLRYPAHQWPQQKRTGIVSDEIRACYAHRQLKIPEQLIEVDRFSSWRKMLRTMAHVLRFVNNCRTTLPGQGRNIGHLTQFELQKAEEYLFRAVQWECFVDELATLTNNQKLPYQNRQELERTSPLYKLSPILDSSGVLRLDSRISAALHVPAEMKHPIILPKRHRLTTLVLEDLHRQLLHANNESVVNEARQRFYIPQLRTQVRQMAKQCLVCKIRRAQPAVPRMAPLPTARLASYLRPFTYCGLDYFGPVLVKVNRSHVKRWVAIFTCLTIRAVHVEVVYKLDIESCIKAVRRFICRRGSPAEIYSDNATCFRGTERLLRDQINKGLAAKFTSTQTEWKFIPPSTPHMGGAWERMVRSVKVALSSLQDSSEKLNDESLQTFLAEAEAIVNCRPLTYLPLDSIEQEALTPNHFLLGSSSGVRLPVVQTTDEVSLLKGSWTTIQKLLDIFWKRWVREYLPTLTRRTKWFGETKPIQPGDLVFIIDDTRRNGWVRGRVLEVLPAADGRVRQAVVQTAGKAPSKKSVSKLAVLEISKDPGTQVIPGFHRGEDVAKLATAPGRKSNQAERNDEETCTDENRERNRKQ